MLDLSIPPVVIFSISFLLVALAAKQIGAFFSRYGLPYITGYLLAGALAGPFILGMLPTEATGELRYIDDVSLAVIAFVAGSELFLKDLRSRLRTILLNVLGIVVAAFILLGIAIYFLQATIPFTAGFDPVTKIAVATLGATILLALSPASTIAVIQEVRARGSFSKTVLSITVVMDVVIIVLFAVSVAFAGALIDGDALNAQFLVLLVIDIAIALLAGYLLGRLFGLLLSTPLDMSIKIGLLLLSGFVVFEAGYRVPEWSEALIGAKIKIEPLLISMVAGFTVTNFTNYRHEFEEILHDISPYVYVAFFALTGVALKLDILVATLGVALALFGVRMFSIFVGTYAGGTIAGESRQFRRWAWLGLITQAGIALGLARETGVEFPNTLGNEFATLIISVVVLNEIFGPLFLKFALRRTGESHEPPGEEADQVCDAFILGVEQQSIALARQLQAEGWRVTLADTDAEAVERLAAHDVDERLIPCVDAECMSQFMHPGLDAVVAMLPNEADNLLACQIAYEEYGIRNLIVRLQSNGLRDSFRELGVRMIDPATAMVSLLDQYVRTPEAAELLMHRDPDYDLVQVRVTQEDVAGKLLRDLRLPTDVLVLEINRKGQPIVPHGSSSILIGDKVTLVGKPESLEQVTLRFGY